MATPRPRLNSAEIQKMLNAEGRYSGVEDMLVSKMRPVLDRAYSGAPVDSGKYRDGLALRVDRTDRVVARVVATAPHSHLVETKTGNLSRAFDAAGGE